MTYKQTSMSSSGTPSSQYHALGLHRDSRRSINKVQPKIRIIHIYAPEIIKTDVANFRELVQRLTGKPSAESIATAEGFNKGKGKGKKVNRMADNEDGRIIGCDHNKSTVNTKLEVMMQASGSSSSPSSSLSDHHHHHHDHQHQHHHDNNNQEFWRSTGDQTSAGGFLSAFSDIDDHFDLSMFTVGPADHHNSSHLTTFGESAQVSFRG